MKKTALVAALALLATVAHAQQYVANNISSVTWSNVTLSSTTPTRIDNLILGTTGQVMPGRNAIVITMVHGTSDMNCEYYVGTATDASQVSLSTVSAPSPSVYLGQEFAPPAATQGGPWTVPISSNLSFWCQNQAASTVPIHVQQVAPFNLPRTIP